MLNKILFNLLEADSSLKTLAILFLTCTVLRNANPNSYNLFVFAKKAYSS